MTTYTVQSVISAQIGALQTTIVTRYTTQRCIFRRDACFMVQPTTATVRYYSALKDASSDQSSRALDQPRRAAKKQSNLDGPAPLGSWGPRWGCIKQTGVFSRF